MWKNLPAQSEETAMVLQSDAVTGAEQQIPANYFVQTKDIISIKNIGFDNDDDIDFYHYFSYLS